MAGKPAGFTHTAFVFGSESTVAQSDIDGKVVPVGALLTFIQKGFQLMELEANLTEDGNDVYGEYVGLTARDILTKDIDELRESARKLKLRQAAEAAERPEHSIHPSTYLHDGQPPHGFVVTQSAIPLDELPENCKRQLKGHVGAVLSMSWSKGSQSLATASLDGSVRIWNCEEPDSGSLLCSMQPGDSAVGLEWNPMGSVLAGMMTSGDIVMWNASDGTSRTRIPCEGGPAVCLAWNPSGTIIATGLADGTIAYFNPNTGGSRGTWHLPDGGAVYHLSWCDDDECAVAGQNGEVATTRLGDSKIYIAKDHGLHKDMAEGTCNGPPTAVAAGMLEAVNEVAWSHSRQVLASASNDMTIGLWHRNVEEGMFKRLRGHKREVITVAWCPQEIPKRTALGNDKGSVQKESRENHKARLNTLRLLASGSLDGSVRIWNIEDERCLCVLDRHEGNVACMAWSSCGNRIAVGDSEGYITIWNLKTATTSQNVGMKDGMEKGTSRRSNSNGEALTEVLASVDFAVVGPGPVSSLQWLDSDGSRSVAVAFGDSSDVFILRNS